MKERYIRELVKLTRASSDKVLEATIDHMVKGLTQKEAAEKYGVNQPDVAKLKKRFIELDEHITILNKLRK